MTSAYEYRPKFKDISIGASKKRRGKSGTAESEPETEAVTCEHKGCDAAGDFKSVSYTHLTLPTKQAV